MKQPPIHITFILIFLLLTPLAQAAESTEDYAEWERRINKEIEIIDTYLEDAEKGDKRAMAVLIRLANDEYIYTAEGSVWLNEIYLDLMVRYPYSFLLIVSKEPDEIKDKIIEELLAPLTFTYSKRKLRKAVQWAQKKGLKDDFLEDMIEFYSQN